jgi:hypothetical protein
VRDVSDITMAWKVFSCGKTPSPCMPFINAIALLGHFILVFKRAKTYMGFLGFVLISSTGAKLNCSPNLYFALQFEPPFYE